MESHLNGDGETDRPHIVPPVRPNADGAAINRSNCKPRL